MITSNESKIDQLNKSDADTISPSSKNLPHENKDSDTSPPQAPQSMSEPVSVRFVVNIPNILTVIRLLAVIPLAILISYWPEKRMVTVILFASIWMTDFLDGFIARHFQMITEFGKLFDPFVDKVFQVVTIVMLFSAGIIPLWVPLFYVLRESVMLFASTLLLAKHHVVVYSDHFGKISTFLFVLAVGVLYLVPTDKEWVRNVVFILPILMSTAATIHYAFTQVQAMRVTNGHAQHKE